MLRSALALTALVAATAVASAPAATRGASGRPGYEVAAEIVWRAPVERAGTGSPRAADLNGDGLDDVVLGAGVEDHRGEVVALDGATGRRLWARRLADEVLVASPLVDVDGDGVREVFASGRARLGDVYALNGRTGETVWQLTRANPDARFLPINFINVLRVDDRDGDGLPDLLVVQSGGRDSRRPAARFHWVRSADGTLLGSGVAPDGNESYAMPLFEDRAPEDDRLYVGTGGDTFSGHLLALRLPSLEEQWRIRSTGGGFLGSPLLADLDGDGRDEIVAIGTGAVHRVDAADGSARWRWHERPYWTYASPVVGAFDDGTVLDVFAAFNRGAWPRSAGVELLWLDGASGGVISRREVGGRFRFAASSPLTLDVDRDGRDEVLLVLTTDLPGPPAAGQAHRLVILDGGADRAEVLGLELDGYSIATPRLGDLDGDGKLDVLHATRDEVLRIELTISVEPGRGAPPPPRVRWGELRGPDGAGILR